MTQIITMTRDMRPWARGDRYIVSDAQAKELVESGAAVNPEPYGPPEDQPSVVAQAVEKVVETAKNVIHGTLRLPAGRPKSKGLPT
jgi:hypothetical protein